MVGEQVEMRTPYYHNCCKFFLFLNIDLFFHPSKQQQELNNEIEILVSINAESKHFQRKPIRSIVVVVELYNVKFIITASLGSF